MMDALIIVLYKMFVIQYNDHTKIQFMINDVSDYRWKISFFTGTLICQKKKKIIYSSITSIISSA